MSVNALPKVELHVHLDCSLSYRAVSHLDPSISREQFDSEFVGPYQCKDLADFLTRAPRGFQLMQSRDALRLVTYDLFEQFAADNVIYAEIRFAPLLHLNNGLSVEEVVEAVDRAAEESIRSTGIEARLILCTLRHFSSEQSLLTAELVRRYKGSRIVALDIAGDEAGYPLEPHIPAFRFAAECGANRTAHAGEARGPASVWETLRALDPERIGHGVRSAEDPELVDHLKKELIHLEICPSSNIQTGIYAKYGDHPIDKLLRAGISLGINTDARTITNIHLREEYARLQKHFDWSSKEILDCNQAALEAAFVDSAIRQGLHRKLLQT